MSTDNKEQVRKAFSSRFCKALNELGYSVNNGKKMKELFGVTRQSACKWADGSTMPAMARMPAVASALGVRRAWLQDGEEPMRPVIGEFSNEAQEDGGGLQELFRMEEAEVKLVCTYRGLTTEQKEAMHNVMLLFNATSNHEE